MISILVEMMELLMSPFFVMSYGTKVAIIYGLHDDFFLIFRIISFNVVIGIPFRN
jgi:hypothetical protein